MCDDNIRLSNFEQKSDGQKECVMDHIIAWSLKHASIIYKTKQPKLYSYCKSILSKLLEINNEEVYFSKVMTALQVPIKGSKQKIDIVCEVTSVKNQKREQWALLIEDKYFGNLTNILSDYKNYFDSQYNDLHRKYALITCVDKADPNFKKYDSAEILGFKVFSICELIDKILPDTESDIYNEFWLRNW